MSEQAAAFDLSRVADGQTSLRELARQLAMPASTFHRIDQRRRALEAVCPEWASFFLSAGGSEFLRLMVLALHLVFGIMGANGCALICQFLKLLGLERFVGASEEAQRQVSRRVQDLLDVYAKAQLHDLTPDDHIKRCALGVDETFPHQGQSLLIAQELCSGYVVMQQFSARRDAETWAGALCPHLHALGIVVEQVVSDQAPGLKGLAKLLAADHSIDLFHVQQPVVKPTFG